MRWPIYIRQCVSFQTHEIPFSTRKTQKMNRHLIKYLPILFLAGFLVQTATAQEKYFELLRSDIRADRVALVTEAMALSDANAELFWPIYREYEYEQSKLGDEKIQLIKDYAAGYTQMTDDLAKDLMERVFDLDKDILDLQKKYFKKMDKELPSTVAVKFFQIDRQILMLMNLQIAAELPLIMTGS